MYFLLHFLNEFLQDWHYFSLKWIGNIYWWNWGRVFLYKVLGFFFFLYPSPGPLPSGNHKLVLCIYESVFWGFASLIICFVFLGSTYKWNHVIFIFLWVLKHSCCVSEWIVYRLSYWTLCKGWIQGSNLWACLW